MRSNLSKLERELAKAKEVISAQGGKLRLLDHEKHNIHVKFKDELARATQTMRHEVEKMREVSLTVLSSFTISLSICSLTINQTARRTA